MDALTTQKRKVGLFGNDFCKRIADNFLRSGNIVSSHKDSITSLECREIRRVIVLGDLVALDFMLPQSGESAAESNGIIPTPRERWAVLSGCC